MLHGARSLTERALIIQYRSLTRHSDREETVEDP